MGCAIAVDRWANADFESLLSENRQKNDNDDDSGTDDDSGDGTDDDSGDDSEPDDDSGDGQPKITRADLDKAIADYRAGLITAEEMRKIANGWSCQQYGGHYCRYAQ